MTATIESKRARHADQCLFCASRRCFVRIYTGYDIFDEIACSEHVRDLEAFADRHLKGADRVHQTCSERVQRKSKRCWMIFLVDAREIGKPIRLVSRIAGRLDTERLGEALLFDELELAQEYAERHAKPKAARRGLRTIVGRMD